MKHRNSKPGGSKLSLQLFIAVVAMVFLFSCKKGLVNRGYSKNDIAEAAGVLDGELMTGNIISKSDKNELAVNYNGNNKIILIDKLTNTECGDIGDIKSAEVMISNYGIIIKDLSVNKTFLFINNDEKSIDKFKAVQLLFRGNLQPVIVFGTTIISSERV